MFYVHIDVGSVISRGEDLINLTIVVKFFKVSNLMSFVTRRDSKTVHALHLSYLKQITGRVRLFPVMDLVTLSSPA